MPVTATVFTDPFCPWSWAAEPALRRLQAEFGGRVEVSFVLVGLARQVDEARARELALAALDAAAASGMPADPRVWLRDPPASTYPASIAVHAVAEQADPGPYLRRLREAVLLERRRMDTPDVLLDAAKEVGGLDLDRLRIDFGSHAILERFGADLERARAVPVTSTPSVRFGEDAWATGAWEWAAWRAAALAAGLEPVAEPLSAEDALRRFGAMTTAEVAVVCELPGPRAAAELWRLALEWRVTPRRVLGGELWTAA